MVEAQKVILHPVISENAILMVERDNKLIFMVDKKTTKADVKRAVETLYKVKVERVNVLITPLGEKKAFVKLDPESKATDLAIKLGIL